MGRPPSAGGGCWSYVKVWPSRSARRKSANPSAGGVEVQIANLGVAAVAEAVHHERRDARERAGRHDRSLPIRAEHHGQLALEDEEHVGVLPMNVEVGAFTVWAEARPRRVQRVVIGQDLDSPIGRVTDDLAASAGDQDGVAHERRVCPPMLS